jgi:uncharacterized protein YraI
VISFSRTLLVFTITMRPPPTMPEWGCALQAIVDAGAVQQRVIAPEYFTTMGIPVIAGRARGLRATAPSPRQCCRGSHRDARCARPVEVLPRTRQMRVCDS